MASCESKDAPAKLTGSLVVTIHIAHTQPDEVRAIMALERLLEVDEVLHQLLRKTNLEPLVVKIYDLLEIGSDSVTDVAGTLH
jgi:hypothetical protein